MEDTRVTFETAKLAKEKGFKEKVIYYYHLHDNLKIPILINEVEILLKNYKTPYEVRRDWNTISTEFGYIENFSAPTQSLLAKWLREKHEIYVTPRESYAFDQTLEFVCSVNNIFVNHGNNDEPINRFKVYEDAYEKGLQEALKLIKND